MLFSLIIPAYNEAAKIERDLEAAREFLSAQPFLSEVLVVDDGSIDDTAAKVEAFIQRVPGKHVVFRFLRYGENRGKGYAIRYGVARAKGEMVGFMDAGLCVPLSYLLTGMAKLREGFDFAIASRRVQGAVIRQSQPWHRRAGSKLFWVVIQAWMGVRCSDTQCGFKVYTGKAAKLIFSRLATDGFMFDIEALMTAKRLGLRGAEFAVEWSNDSDTRYHPVWGTFRNFKELARIKMRKEIG